MSWLTIDMVRRKIHLIYVPEIDCSLFNLDLSCLMLDLEIRHFLGFNFIYFQFNLLLEAVSDYMLE